MFVYTMSFSLNYIYEKRTGHTTPAAPQARSFDVKEVSHLFWLIEGVLLQLILILSVETES